MAVKIGGGNKLQKYNKNNGEYCRNPICEEDEKNLMFKKIFNIKTNIPIAYPKFGIHDLLYCKLIILYCLNFEQKVIDDNKFLNYLLINTKCNDKSKILNSIGYSLNNWYELKEQILIGTAFKKRKLSKFSHNSFCFNTETIILNKNNNSYYYCTTSWFVEKDFSIKFVTLIPEVYKDDESN